MRKKHLLYGALYALLLVATASGPTLATMWSWSQTANNNATADATINFAEGQAPSSINNSARALMASVAKYRDDVSGMLNSTGSSNAYAVTTNQTLTALTDGFTIAFRANHTNDGAATIDVDTLGSKPLRAFTGTALSSGVIVTGSIYKATYDSGDDEWLLINPVSSAGLAVVPTGAVFPFASSTAPTGYLLAYGQCVSRTTYAALFAVISTTYSACDGSTTFGIPDLRGRVVAGEDDMGGSSANRLTGLTDGVNGDTLGASGGLESTTLTEAQMPSHRHNSVQSATSGGDLNTSSESMIVQNLGVGDGAYELKASSSEPDISRTSATGSSSAHNAVQPTFILAYIIKI